MTNHRDAEDRPTFGARLPRLPQSAGEARKLISKALKEWELREGEDAAWLVVTELFTNAVLHARRGTVRVVVTRTGERTVRVAVIDRSRRSPRPRDASPVDVTGRGLALVAGMCDDQWGVTHLRDGKAVWAELEVPLASETVPQ